MKNIREAPDLETKNISEDDITKIINLVEVLKSAFFNYITELDKILDKSVGEIEKKQENIRNNNLKMSERI